MIRSALTARLDIPGAASGPLAGLAFAIKDNMAVKDHVSGCGSPDWGASRAPEAATAPLVRTCLDLGARLIGRTVMDELACSLTGENVHFGTPPNSAAPDRIPGGSSSGSASVVASGGADFALGTDTGGSVRFPAGCCGLMGLRFTQGLLSVEGIVPLAKTMDAPGVFAARPEIFDRVSAAILASRLDQPPKPERLVVLDDAFDLAFPSAGFRQRREAELLGRQYNTVEHARLGDLWGRLPQLYFAIQSFESWRDLGQVIERGNLRFGPGVAERFIRAKKATWADYQAALKSRDELRAELDARFGSDHVLCMPTMPDAAPRRGQDEGSLAPYLTRSLKLLALASVTGRPQVTWPIPSEGQPPLGLSLMGCAGTDRHLVRAAVLHLEHSDEAPGRPAAARGS
jgi:amidase